MKKTLLLTTAAVLFSFSVQAAPAANQTASAPKETKTIAPYASVKAVYSWERVKLKNDEGSSGTTFKAPGLNAAVGAKIDDFRVEFEYGFRSLKQRIDVDEDGAGYDKFGMSTYMINGYYDIRNSSIVTPYVGIGLGFADMKLKYSDEENLYSKSKTKFAYSLNAGIGIEVAKNITVDVGYRYLKPGNFKFLEGIKVETHTNEISAGVRFDF